MFIIDHQIIRDLTVELDHTTSRLH